MMVLGPVELKLTVVAETPAAGPVSVLDPNLGLRSAPFDAFASAQFRWGDGYRLVREISADEAERHAPPHWKDKIQDGHHFYLVDLRDWRERKCGCDGCTAERARRL